MIEQHFRTTFTVKKPEKQINYYDRLGMIGSCFTENVGRRLREHQFRTLLNPSGILFNPLSITRTVQDIVTNRTYVETDLHNNLGTWFSFAHHGRFSGTDKYATLEQINTSMEKAASFFHHLNYLFVSPGTAWVYRLKETGEVVANCHKVPGDRFEKSLLGPDEITAAFDEMIRLLKERLPELKIIFTLSPVRHIRDGIENDRISKSVLRWAIHQCVTEHSNACYFPAYELLTDDLRDYRFYDKDFVHPSQLALDYIWTHFKETWIEPSAFGLMDTIGKLNAAMVHRPLFPETGSHEKFVKSQLKKIDELEAEHDFLDLSAHREHFQSSLHKA